jgi:hypothetical protein
MQDLKKMLTERNEQEFAETMLQIVEMAAAHSKEDLDGLCRLIAKKMASNYIALSHLTEAIRCNVQLISEASELAANRAAYASHHGMSMAEMFGNEDEPTF